MRNPSISVVIPVFNGEKYLAEAIQSVLNQTVPPSEIIVIDDGSTDHTAAVCRDFGDQIHYLKQENQGAAAARNLGIKEAAGTYLAFLDADDLWMPTRLQEGLSRIEENDSPGILFGMIEEFYSPETDESFRNRYKCAAAPVKGIHPGTMLIRCEDFLHVGPFSIEFKTGEFIEWFKRAEMAGFTHEVSANVQMKRRIHYTNHGIVHKNSQSDYAKIVMKMLKEKRNQPKVNLEETL